MLLQAAMAGPVAREYEIATQKLLGMIA